MGFDEKTREALSLDVAELPGIRWLVDRLALSPGGGGSRWRAAKVLLYEDLAAMTRQRAPLDVALKTSGATKDWRLARVSRRLLEQVHAGKPLSQAMARVRIFAPQEIQIVKAGEEWSALPEALDRLARFGSVMSGKQDPFVAAMMYPIHLGVIFLSIETFLILKIVPKLAEMWAVLGAGRLPPLTRAFVRFGQFVASWPEWPRLIVALLALAVIWIIMRRWPAIVAIRSWLAAHLPIVGKSYRAAQNAQWLAAFSLALRSKAAAHEALRAAGEICGGPMRARSEAAARMVEQGKPIGEACVAHHVLYGPSNHRLALINWNDDFVARLQEIASDADSLALHAIERAARRLEVVTHLCIAFLAAICIIACYMPLFEMGRLIW